MSRYRLVTLVGFSCALVAACGGDDVPANDNNGNQNGNTNAPSVCGNGVQEVDEQCDEGAANSDLAPDACRTDCRLARCGDDVVDAGEQCDGAPPGGLQCADVDPTFTGGTLACDAACQLDTGGCSVCGNGVREAEEQCDGTDLDHRGCADITGEQHGVLRCAADCTFDAAACHTCGDGVIKADLEECEPGDFAGESCLTLGYTWGELRCEPLVCQIDDQACHAFCGNGMAEIGEQCDGVDLPATTCADVSANFTSGQVSCSPACRLSVATCGTCGNGTLEPTEECDGAHLGGETCQTLGGPAMLGTLGCTASCRLDVSGCEPLSTCGNGVLETNEQCEGENLNGYTCASLRPDLYGGGHLICAPNCLFDTAQCEARSPCGNGTLEPLHGEVCDGADLGGETCAGLGFGGGTLACTDECTLDTSGCVAGPPCGDAHLDPGEQCDGASPPGLSCQSLGFLGGILGCTPQCTLDTSTCTSCGDGVRQADEACDGADLGELHCSDVGFYRGVLACTPECQLDAAGCTLCGNGAMDAGEECDAEDFGGATCGPATAGTYPDGQLRCDAGCGYDPSGCHDCGNWLLEGPEICDGTVGAETCVTRGYSGGYLGCASDCLAFDETSCYTCGDGVCEDHLGENAATCVADCGWQDVQAGSQHTCGLRRDGSVWCWGSNQFSSLGIGVSGGTRVLPTRVVGLDDVLRITVRGEHACAVRGDSSLWCWGRNSAAQLGDGTTNARDMAAAVPGLTGGVATASAGIDYTCAVLLDGSLWCWGANTHGQLGDGSTSPRYDPTEVTSLPGVASVTTSWYDPGAYVFTCARRASGAVWCWGSNNGGQLGTGAGGSDWPNPQWVAGLGTNAEAVSTGAAFGCARMADQTVQCWGNDSGGVLGNGVGASQPTPGPVSSLTSVALLSTGYTHSVAVLADGTLWTWGADRFGSLGLGPSPGQQDVPVQVTSLANVARANAGHSHTCAVLQDGSAWCWGQGTSGQLGNGQTLAQSYPVPVLDPP